MDWRSMVPIFRWICYDVQKSTLKIRATFLQKSAKPFWRNAYSPLEKNWIKFNISFRQLGWNSEEIPIFSYFATWTQIAYFLKPFEESVAQWRRVGWIFDNISSTRWNSVQNGNVQLFRYMNSNCVLYLIPFEKTM